MSQRVNAQGPQVRSGVVSVVLVNYRGADDTITCLRAFDDVDWPSERLELIVVDNDSGDDSVQRIRVAVPAATVIDAGSNTGFAGGCNLGVARATGQYVAFINNDARPHAQWLSEAVAVFETDSSVGSVASKVLDWDGKLAGRRGVFQLGLAVGDGEQGLRRMRVVGCGGNERAEGGDRVLVLAVAVLRVAEPEQHRLAVAAARVALAERRQRTGRAGEVALAQQRHRVVVLALLFGVGGELLAVDRDSLRRQLAHAVDQAGLQVFLLALQIRHVARELLVLAAQRGVVAARLFELAVQIEQAALELVDLVGQVGQAGALLFTVLVELLAQLEDRAARFVVLEQTGVRSRREQRRPQAQPAEDPRGAVRQTHGGRLQR